MTQAREGGFKIFTSTRSDGYHWKADISEQKVYLEVSFYNIINCIHAVILVSFREMMIQVQWIMIRQALPFSLDN